MGQKINPIGFRIGINRSWDSTWFAKKKDFGRLLIEDFKIRNYIKKNNLLPWFTMDHGQLPAAYLKSTQEFFDELQATSNKRQATSSPQLESIIKNRKV